MSFWAKRSMRGALALVAFGCTATPWMPAAQAQAPKKASVGAAAAAEAGGGEAQLAATALTHTRALVAAYGRCGEVAAEKTCPELDDLFDFDELTRAPLAGHTDKMTPAQRTRLTRAFGTIVRRAARFSGKDLGRGDPQMRFVGRTPKGAKSDVHVARPEDDVDMHVAFVWRTGAKRWRVVDVELDGASMVQDYHNQFGRVLKKEGPEALVARVESRSKAAAQSSAASGTDAEP